MKHQIQDISAFKYANDSGIVATVKFLNEDHDKTISVSVRIPYDIESSLSDIEQQLLDKAKKQLIELVSEI